MARRATVADWILTSAIGALVVVAGAVGISSALERADDTGQPDGTGFFVSGAFGHGGDADRAGIDPYAPPGLPAGVVIDRESGRMVGLDFPGGSDASAVRWETIDRPYPDGEADISDAIRALDGKPVVMVGFLKAVYAVTDIREFLLVGSHLACCFGTIPGPGGMLMVTLADDQPSAEMMVEPILVHGTFRIRPQYTRRPRRPVVLYVLEGARVERLEGG